MEDVYLSSSGNAGVISLWTKSARCHRCCYLFKVPRWKHVPEKEHSHETVDQQSGRRVA